MPVQPATRRLPPDGPARLRLAGATAVSLLVHALIISLQFGVPGIGLPSLDLPWRERRAQAVDLSVVLAPAAPAPAVEPPAPAIDPVPVSPAPAGLRLVPLPAAPAPKAKKKRAAEKPVPPARPPRARAKRETPVIALNEARDDTFNMPAPAVDEILPMPEPEADSPPAPAVIPEPAAAPEEDPAARERELTAQKLAEEETARHAREAEEDAARLQAEAQAAQLAEEARRLEEATARLQALAQEEEAKQRKAEEQAAERLALDMEAQKKAEEANRQAAALALRQREDALRREREEAARRALELEEKQLAEAQQLQAEQAQREAMELQARKQAEAMAEAARQQAAARERERQAEELAARRKAEAEAAAEVARANAARREPDPELAIGDSPAPGARIDALPRGLTGGGLAGRALEQARRGDILRNDPPSARQSNSSTEAPRRRSIFGSKDVDVGLMMYVESWRLKIERNGSIMYPRAAVEKARGDPVVTVAVRSDGSVEEVVIHRSSGRQELDEAVHRIVRMNARYSVFPPELARRYDVIEIRRVWNFEDRLRVLEEVR